MEKRYENIIMDINSVGNGETIIPIIDEYNFYFIKNDNIRKEINKVINETGLTIKKSLVVSEDKEVLLESSAIGLNTCLVSDEKSVLFDHIIKEPKEVNSFKKIVK